MNTVLNKQIFRSSEYLYFSPTLCKSRIT